MTSQLHETLSRDEDVPRASERSFGIVFAVVFGVIAAWPLFNGNGLRIWALIVALLFAGLGLFAPFVLKPLNTAWLAFGYVLHKIVSPVIMGVVYAVAVVPTGLYLRLSGRDPLRLKLDKSANTYWQKREPPGPPPGSLKNQF